jgi:uncharacterized protein
MEFVLHTCNQCGERYTQKKYLCSSCRHDTFSEIETSGRGKVFSYTTIHISSPEYQHLAPYNVVLVELEEGLKLTGRMKAEVKIEDKVKLSEKEDGAYIFEKFEW